MRATWSELKNKTMTTAEQRKARRLADSELAEIEINQLRETMKMTQTELAQKLKVTQAAVSRLEGRSDWRLSTLKDFVQALGGEVEVLARFANRTVRLTHSSTRGSGRVPAPNRTRSRRR
jgi:predicted XRE-type DNA-binding protein